MLSNKNLGVNILKVFTGVDIVEIDRIKNSIDKLGDKFLEKIFTLSEIEYCESKKGMKYQSYAVRFAVKEAVAKLLKTGIGNGVSFRDIVIENDVNGAPYVSLSGGASLKCKALNINEISVSMSHCKQYAIGHVVGVTK